MPLPFRDLYGHGWQEEEEAEEEEEEEDELEEDEEQDEEEEEEEDEEEDEDEDDVPLKGKGKSKGKGKRKGKLSAESDDDEVSEEDDDEDEPSAISKSKAKGRGKDKGKSKGSLAFNKWSSGVTCCSCIAFPLAGTGTVKEPVRGAAFFSQESESLHGVERPYLKDHDRNSNPAPRTLFACCKGKQIPSHRSVFPTFGKDPRHQKGASPTDRSTS